MTKPIKRPHSTPEVAEWPAKQDVEHVLNALGPPATAQSIKSILAKLDPSAARTECLSAVVGALQMIASAKPFEPPGRRRKQFEAAAVAATKLHTALKPLKPLPDYQRRGLLDSDLDRLIEWCSNRISKLDEVIKHSGGERLNSGRKVVAFRGAYDLLLLFGGGKRPAGERLYALADALFKAATGKAGSCKNICVECLRGMRQK